jgi:hypothetical protein
MITGFGDGPVDDYLNGHKFIIMKAYMHYTLSGRIELSSQRLNHPGAFSSSHLPKFVLRVRHCFKTFRLKLFGFARVSKASLLV